MKQKRTWAEIVHEIDKSSEGLPGKPNTRKDDQIFALKRIHTILDGHKNDKFDDKNLCHIFNQLYELTLKFFKGDINV